MSVKLFALLLLISGCASTQYSQPNKPPYYITFKNSGKDALISIVGSPEVSKDDLQLVLKTHCERYCRRDGKMAKIVYAPYNESRRNGNTVAALVRCF